MAVPSCASTTRPRHPSRLAPRCTTCTDGLPDGGPEVLEARIADLAEHDVHPGSLVVVISDFAGFTLGAQSYLSSVARHNEVLAVFINDPLERDLPPPGRYRLVAPNDELAIDTFAAAARRDYHNAFEQRKTELEKFCQRYGIHLMPMSTDDDPVSTLQQALGRRTR